MKKDFLWFDEQLWSALCAGPKGRLRDDGAAHQAIMKELQLRQGNGSKDSRGKAGSRLFIMALLLTSTLLGCNMMRGAGKDVESAGSGIQRIVDHND